MLNSMHEQNRFSSKTLGNSLFHFQNERCSHGPAGQFLLLESALWGSVVKIVGSSVWWVLVLVLVPVNSPVWSWHVGVLVGLWAGRCMWDSSYLGEANQTDLVLRLIRVKQSCMLALSECREALVRLVCLRPLPSSKTLTFKMRPSAQLFFWK